MTYILFIVFSTGNVFLKGVSVSQFTDKKTCEIALAAAKEIGGVSGYDSKCIEVKK